MRPTRQQHLLHVTAIILVPGIAYSGRIDGGFVSDDIRRCFAKVGLEEPKSLLQILGTLKRDHGFLLNAGRRGEYMMNTTGITRVRQILGEETAGDKSLPTPEAAAAAAKQASMFFSVSPMYFDTQRDSSTCISSTPRSRAMICAVMVLPVPLGPENSAPTPRP